jgi:hypothetical protein
VPRYRPERPLPSYRHVPGLNPHPRRDGIEIAPGEVSLDDWLWGVDLFNSFFFWEAHEAWEGPWARSPRQSDVALLLQGLIQISAALLKVHLGAHASARRLAATGMDKLARVAHHRPILLGLPVRPTEEAFRTYFRPLAERTLPPLDASVPALLLVGAPLA